MRIDSHTHPVLIQEMVDKYPNYARMARDVLQIGNKFQPLETFRGSHQTIYFMEYDGLPLRTYMVRVLGE